MGNLGIDPRACSEMEAIDFSSPRRAHLVGIAGSGMRSLADVLLAFGWRLSGSDLNIASLQPWPSVRLFEGHSSAHLPCDAEELISSDAVPSSNPEIRLAAQRGLPISSYAQTLGRLGRNRTTLAVSGTHGKSTTTAMTAHLLTRSGLDPTVVYGAALLGKRSGGRAGQGSLLVVEACEYRENFLHLHPQQAAILGIEPDHFDCFDSLDHVEAAFRRFAAALPTDGWLLARRDCPSTRRVLSGASCRVETFGLSSDADWSAHRLVDRDGFFQFDIHRFGQRLGTVQLSVPGEFNVLNALAAAALASHNGVPGDTLAEGLGHFPGLHRRLEVLGTWRNATWIDDYAHHPTEISESLKAVRRMFPRARVWCVVQPHQASRTRRLLKELAASLQRADIVLVAEIFRAREGDPRPGDVTAADLAQQVALLGATVLPGHTAQEIAAILETHLTSGDVLVTLGAGKGSPVFPENERRSFS